VALAESVRDVEISLDRGGVIAGRVVDVNGEPVVGARVTAEVPAGSPAAGVGGTAGTDDRGDYRLAGLGRGPFILSVVTAGGQMVTVMPNGGIATSPARIETYFPNAARPEDASRIELRAGEERGGVDFLLLIDASGNQPFSTTRLFAGFGQNATRQGAPAARGRGIVRGRVLTSDGRALPGAQVALVRASAPRDVRSTRSFTDGAFEFPDLPAGSYRVAASKAGYWRVPSNGSENALSRMMSERAIDLPDGGRVDDVEVTLARWSTLSGHISDEYGDPIQGASVQLLQIRYEAGRRRLVGVGPAATTDDLGAYREYALTAGEYIVSASVGDVGSSDIPGYARSYFPGTPDTGAARFVAVGPSDDVAGIDFSLSRTRTARIAGTILDPDGSPTLGGTVQLLPRWRSASLTTVPVGARLRNGAFEFPNVPPGQYVVQAYRGRLNGWTEGAFGSLPIAIDGADVADLVVQMTPGSSIDGVVTLDAFGAAGRPPLSGLQITTVPVDFDRSPPNGFAVADLGPDGTFRIAGVNGPRRLDVRRVPAGWTLEAIRAGGVDVTDRVLPFGAPSQSLRNVDVVLTDRTTDLRALVVDGDTRPVPRSSVIVFSTDRSNWYAASRFLRLATAGADGSVAISGLPFGSYYVAAVPRPPSDGPDAWQDPAFLESIISPASSVTLVEGQTATVSLKMID
jgi:hypothetical protein